MSVSIASWFVLLRVSISINWCIYLGFVLDKCLGELGLFVACAINALVRFPIVSCFTLRDGIFVF